MRGVLAGRIMLGRILIGMLLAWLCCGAWTSAARAANWTGSSVDRGYVLEAATNRQHNPRRHCVPKMLAGLERQATIEAPPGGWPGEPQAVAVFNVYDGEVMISHGQVAICGQMHDMRTRDSRFRAGVGQVVVPRKGNTDPIIVAWQTPLLPEWVPTIKLGSPNHLQFEDTARLLTRAACMAITISLALSAMMGWLAVRERPFLYYALSCVLFLLWQALINGLAGYPAPWFPFGDQLTQWQVCLGLMSTVLMLVGLWVLSNGQAMGAWRPRWTERIVVAFAVLSLSAFVLPPAGLRLLAVLPLVLLASGSLLVLMLGIVMLVRRQHEAVLGLVALLPFLAIVGGEMSGAQWWVGHRVEALQIAATWLLMMAAYALNRRLGLLRVQRDEMRRLADTDGLTGLANRRYGMHRLKQLHAVAQERGTALSLAFLDVDHFKSINDSCGHEGGDQVLVAMAGLLTESVRSQDDVVRMGGEEFLILLPGVSLESARERMEMVRERVSLLSMGHVAPGLKVTVSIGVAQLDDDDVDADTLLRRADKAMYHAKQAGRDRVQLA